MKKITKVVLAYSGGLDTSVMVRWLVENYGCEVVCFAADLGQGENLKPLEKRAKAAGASKLYVRDVRKEFITDYVYPALRAGAVYEGKYYLATALSRPLITKHLIDIARREKADAIAHGSTGKGNDQVRFEVSAKALAPEIDVLAPVRDWELKTRDQEIEYAKKHKIPVDVTKKSPFSYDQNLWGISCECGFLEDPENAPQEHIYLLTKNPDQAPARGVKIAIRFDKGVPVALDGKRLAPQTLVDLLNKLGAKHGVGRVDMLENRLVGIKSREVYENPAATILHTARNELEALASERDVAHYRRVMAERYAELIYYGQWFSPLRTAMDGFFERANETVTGTITLKLIRGRIEIMARKSPVSLYNFDLATYGDTDTFDQSLAAGFNRIWGLPLENYGSVHRIKK